MHSRLFLLSTVVLLSTCPATAFADSGPEVPYTLQVGAFPRADLADKFVVKLVQAGEHPSCATVELEGRGYWTRVSVGLFSTSTAARRYGESLIAKGIVNEFLVRRADLSQAASRPRRVTAGGSVDRQAAVKSLAAYVSGSAEVLAQMSLNLRPVANRRDSLARDAGNITVKAKPLRAIGNIAASRPLADFRPAALELGPCVDTRTIPRPEPVALAFRLIVGEKRPGTLPSQDRGGLWLTGDTAEGLERLKWIAGEENAELVRLDNDGRLQLDRKLLAKAARLDRSHVEDPLQVAYYISANEGLLLLVQLAEGGYRYRIHVGRHVPTRGKTVEITGSINLDRNFDSRINKYRKNGKKLDEEQPPEGVDSLVGLNPIARWFNLSTNYWVQSGEILFHELAEAYAKLELGLDYLERGSEPGAHALALERERRLQSQRPAAHIVMTVGSNRVLRTQAEIRLFYAESVTAASQR